MNEKDEPRPGDGQPATPGQAASADRPLTPVRPWLRGAAESERTSGERSDQTGPTRSQAPAPARPAGGPEHRPGTLSPVRPWQLRRTVDGPAAESTQEPASADAPASTAPARPARPSNEHAVLRRLTADLSSTQETPAPRSGLLRRRPPTDTPAPPVLEAHVATRTRVVEPPAANPPDEPAAEGAVEAAGEPAPQSTAGPAAAGRLRRAAGWLFEQAPERATQDGTALDEDGDADQDADQDEYGDADEPTWTRAELLTLAGVDTLPAEPEPTPEPGPTPAAVPEPEPIPTPEPAPLPEPEPTPQPAPVPEPEPIPTPEPAPLPEPEPTPDPGPAPVQASQPEAAVAPRRRPRPGPGPVVVQESAERQPPPASAPTVVTPVVTPLNAEPPRANVRPVTSEPEPTAPAAPPSGPSHARSLNTDGPRRLSRQGVRRAIQTLVTVCIVVVAAVLVRTFVAAPYYIPSASMEPTLHGCTGCNNDHVLVNKLSYKLHDVHRGDVVVFNRPSTWQVSESHLIKRVIGLPGDTLSVRKGKLYVNGLELQEPYLNSNCGPMTSLGESPAKATTTYGPVPKDDVFVMGDNRCDSSDSRAFGPVPESDIVGRAFVIIWPLGRLHYL